MSDLHATQSAKGAAKHNCEALNRSGERCKRLSTGWRLPDGRKVCLWHYNRIVNNG